MSPYLRGDGGVGEEAVAEGVGGGVHHLHQGAQGAGCIKIIIIIINNNKKIIPIQKMRCNIKMAYICTLD